MIFTLLATLIIGVLSAVTSFLPTVTTLPFGIDTAIGMFSSVLHGIFNIFPWLGFVWQLIVFALGIKFLLFTWHWVRYILTLIRG